MKLYDSERLFHSVGLLSLFCSIHKRDIYHIISQLRSRWDAVFGPEWVSVRLLLYSLIYRLFFSRESIVGRHWAAVPSRLIGLGQFHIFFFLFSLWRGYLGIVSSFALIWMLLLNRRA